MGTTPGTPPASGFGTNLTDRIVSRDAEIAVLGQGYIGLTLAATAVEAGFRVTGIDIDADRIDRLSGGEHAVPGVDEALLRAAFDGGLLSFTTDAAAIGRAQGVFICVPTPVRDHTPDLSFIQAGATEVAEHLSFSSVGLGRPGPARPGSGYSISQSRASSCPFSRSLGYTFPWELHS